MRLRRLIAPAQIETTPHGYRLVPEHIEVDAERFERLVERGTQQLEFGEPERAAHTFSEALALWRGEPFVELPDWEPAQIASGPPGGDAARRRGAASGRTASGGRGSGGRRVGARPRRRGTVARAALGRAERGAVPPGSASGCARHRAQGAGAARCRARTGSVHRARRAGAGDPPAGSRRSCPTGCSGPRARSVRTSACLPRAWRTPSGTSVASRSCPAQCGRSRSTACCSSRAHRASASPHSSGPGSVRSSSRAAPRSPS